MGRRDEISNIEQGMSNAEVSESDNGDSLLALRANSPPARSALFHPQSKSTHTVCCSVKGAGDIPV
jgi:hypothetical protein